MLKKISNLFIPLIKGIKLSNKFLPMKITFYMIKDFNETELQNAKVILNGLITFLNSEKYELNFTEEFRTKKINKIKIAYTNFKSNNILIKFDSNSGYILIAKKLRIINDDILNKMILSYGLVQYLSYNKKLSGLADKYNNMGCGLNVIISEIITQDYFDHIVPNFNELPYLVKLGIAFKNDEPFFRPTKIVKMLELFYGMDIYNYYFSNNTSTMREKLNNEVCQNTFKYEHESPYDNLVYHIDYLVNKVTEEKMKYFNIIEDINKHEECIFELISYALGKDIDKL